MNRPPKRVFFMSVAQLAATQSTCLRRKVGAAIVQSGHVVATGYNGAPRGLSHCQTCKREEMKVPSGERHELCRGVHAEQNAIIQAAKLGQAVAYGDLYCTHSPCVICAKMIVNACIARVFFIEGYPDQDAREVLFGGGVQLIQMMPGEAVYGN